MKVTFFTMILYNSENSICDIRLFCHPLFCHSNVVKQARNKGGHLGHLPPEIFKTLHSNFDIYRNFHKIKMKFYIPNFFKKSSWNFSLSYW